MGIYGFYRKNFIVAPGQDYYDLKLPGSSINYWSYLHLIFAFAIGQCRSTVAGSYAVLLLLVSVFWELLECALGVWMKRDRFWYGRTSDVWVNMLGFCLGYLFDASPFHSLLLHIVIFIQMNYGCLLAAWMCQNLVLFLKQYAPELFHSDSESSGHQTNNHGLAPLWIGTCLVSMCTSWMWCNSGSAKMLARSLFICSTLGFVIRGHCYGNGGNPKFACWRILSSSVLPPRLWRRNVRALSSYVADVLDCVVFSVICCSSISHALQLSSMGRTRLDYAYIAWKCLSGGPTLYALCMIELVCSHIKPLQQFSCIGCQFGRYFVACLSAWNY